MDELDYYSYRPLITPEQPICLASMPGGQAGKTARLISILTGLPLAWLDRSVEHRAGTSIDGLVIQQGEAARHALERKEIPKVLAHKTPHIIALGETTLLDQELCGLLRAKSRLMYLRRPVPSLVAELDRLSTKRRTTYARYFLDQPISPQAVQALVDRLEPPLLAHAQVIDVGELRPPSAAGRVIEALGWELPEVWTRPQT
ncbi:MAG: hypothetical protein EA397_13535 [Deltaproteobacteria bacterium]|nr:MAG: hypothetical protein EA397_13535 [Deltaproteobacteria bacterium]